MIRFTALLLAWASICQVTRAATPILNWGDQGDGTYRNPILKSDFSDPDVIRVGSDFYLVASDFHYVGIQVMHSKDLVNWNVVDQVFHRLDMDPKYDQMAGYGQGTWAPSLRYHNGEFYLFVCTPAEGLFMWHTKDPAGKWSDMVTVKAVPKWEDPCPFWDDDGSAYLVHSLKGAGPIIINKMAPDGTKLLDDGVEVYRGKNSEGPKLYKRHGFYYISLPEGGVKGGWQTVLRSKNIFGPYEQKIVLKDGPHQGGMVELDNGQAWFIGFEVTGFLGRIDYLEPVTWGADDWPVFGNAGEPVEQMKKPDVGAAGGAVGRPQTNDEFDQTSLGLIWQWNHNPVESAWSLTERPGWLRLKGLPAESSDQARNTLTQKLWDETGTIDVKMDVSHLSDGQRAGLTFISGSTFGWVGVRQKDGQRQIAWSGKQNPTTQITAAEQKAAVKGGPKDGPVVSGDEVWLRGTYDGPVGDLSYSLDGQTFVETGIKFPLRYLFWKGAKVGLICYGDGGGWVDVDYFRYRYGK
jgi:beta-xylosidase